MEVISLNTNKQKVAIVDSYKSFIWNDRYEDLGDFELYIPADAVDLLANIHQDYYIQCSESDRTMIVEKVDYRSDIDDGNFVIISGHSLEAILKRRIVWNDDGEPTKINYTKIIDPKSKEEDSGSDFPLWQGIYYLLRIYVIDPECADNKPQRKINGFIFEMPTDLRILSLTMSPCAYQGDNLYDVIKYLCDMYEISFKIVLDDDGNFVFSLYKGVSHLASQTEHPYVCFSSDFDNLLSSDSSLDMSTYKNMAYFKGQGSKYVVDEFDEEEITMETGFIRIHNNEVWAVNTDYGVNNDEDEHGNPKHPGLNWTPDEFNIDYDGEDASTYNTYKKNPSPSTNLKQKYMQRTEYNGAILTEDGLYLATEEEYPADSDPYSDILAYSYGYEEKDKYYECTADTHKGPWDPNDFKQVDIRVTWGPANYDAFVPGTEEEPKEYKDGDCVKYNDQNYRCIEDYYSTGIWDATKWIPVVTHNIMNTNSPLWTKCSNWINGKQYKANDFVTFDDSGRTGKITIYRKSANDSTYGNKKTYKKNAVVWYTYKNKKNMYICKKTKIKGSEEVGIKGVKPINTVWWKKLTDKYQIFTAQQWEALSDMDVEQYDITGNVQGENVGGLDRREMFVDASSVPSTYNHFYNDKQKETVDWLVDDGIMKATVRDMALAELTVPSNRMTKGLEAEIDYSTNFQYRKDYNIGDIVEIRDIYGYMDSVRVKEFIISDDDTGTKCYPSYEAVEASTITTRLLEVDDELLGNTFLVKIPESSRFASATTIATASNGTTTYYLMSFLKKVTSDSPFMKGEKIKRDLHIVAWVTTPEDIYTDYEEQADEDIFKSHPTMVGEPLFYVDIDDSTQKPLPAILFPSWSPPYGTDLGVITEINDKASQYKNILLANI